MTNRRSFLRTLSATAAAGTLGNTACAETGDDRLGKTLPTRKLGRHNEQVTAFTLGGSHVKDAANDKEAQAIIEKAIALGVRSFDNAQNYGGGRAEKLYGQFLTPKYRDDIFLTTKSSRSSGKEVRQELESSLRNMKTDRLDLWQIHTIQSEADVDNRIENGVLDEFLKAREEGKVRYLGFTGHTSFKAHLHMLKRLREMGTQLDTCLMPMNLVDPHYDSFIVNVLPELLKEDYAICAMKTLAFGALTGTGPAWLKQRLGDTKPLTDAGIGVKEMHHYAYSLPICSLCSGCDNPALVEENVGYLKSYRGMDNATRDELIAKAEPFSGATMEYYKG
jgi:aryl-alcohol dehydrogenase-like predicted oxidoreductase